MPLDKDTANLLAQLNALGAPDLSTLSPQEARKLSFTPPPEDDNLEPVPVASVTDRSIPSSASQTKDDYAGEIPIRIYKPCLLYTSPSPRDKRQSRMPSSA